TPTPNGEMLPALFLYRYTPGGETLFRGIRRLMPGEQVTYDSQGMTRSQRRTLGNLQEGRAIGRDAADRIEEEMGRVLADCAVAYPDAVNLLSGGVDSSYIQSHWNAIRPRPGERPRTFGVFVDHPSTTREADYAISAAETLGAEHTLFP